MKTMSAHIFRLSGEIEGKTQKIQNSGRAVTTSIYRGVPGCGRLNFNMIRYPIKQKICCYTPEINIVSNTVIFNGGNPSFSGSKTFNGGNPSSSGPKVINGGGTI